MSPTASGIAYTHITSPIRRIVDIVNMTLLQDKLRLVKYICLADWRDFCTKWQNKVDFINTSTKSIKKVQNGCNLMTLYMNEKVKSVIHQGYLFDRRESKQGKNKKKYSYSVYVPDYKMVSTFKTDELIDDYSRRHFTLHLFMDQANLKEKIRLQEC